MKAAHAQTTKPTWCMNIMQIHVDRNMSLVTASQACTPRFSDATHIVLFGWCFTVITNSDQNVPGREKVHKINNLKAVFITKSSRHARANRLTLLDLKNNETKNSILHVRRPYRPSTIEWPGHFETELDVCSLCRFWICDEAVKQEFVQI